jgi:hypothetical protein
VFSYFQIYCTAASLGAAFKQIEQKADSTWYKFGSKFGICTDIALFVTQRHSITQFCHTQKREVSASSSKKAIRHLQADNEFIAHGVIIRER